jgi:hypothetical protein
MMVKIKKVPANGHARVLAGRRETGPLCSLLLMLEDLFSL